MYLYEKDIKSCVAEHFDKFDQKLQKDKENKLNFYKAIEEYVLKNRKPGVSGSKWMRYRFKRTIRLLIYGDV